MKRTQWVLEEFFNGTWRTLNKGSFDALIDECNLRLQVNPDAQLELYEEQLEQEGDYDGELLQDEGRSPI